MWARNLREARNGDHFGACEGTQVASTRMRFTCSRIRIRNPTEPEHRADLVAGRCGYFPTGRRRPADGASATVFIDERDPTTPPAHRWRVPTSGYQGSIVAAGIEFVSGHSTEWCIRFGLEDNTGEYYLAER